MSVMEVTRSTITSNGEHVVAVPETSDRLRVRFPSNVNPRQLAAWARMMRARYDAAGTTDENRRHWANADDMSSVAANSPAVRRVLRKRARYEVANNGYARHIVGVLGIHTITTGPRLQILDADVPQADRKLVAREFAEWAKEIRLAAKLRLMRSDKATNGEAVAVLTTNLGLDSDVKLDVQTVEADRLAEPTGTEIDSSNVDGVILDPMGNPAGYRILRRHPGDLSAVGVGINEYDEIDVARALHWFPLDRSGQQRGVPEITTSLPLFAMLRRYTLAVVIAAEAAANAAGVLSSDAPPDEESSDDIEPMDTIEHERGMLLTLPRGWKMSQIAAEQPTTTYAEFKRELLKEIAAPLHMPYNIAACDSSDYNFSSGQLDQKVYVASVWVERDDAESVVLRKVLRAWLREARLVPGFLPRSIVGIPLHTWHWDSLDLGDPLKVSKVRDAALRNGTASLASIYAEEGREVEEELQTQADTFGMTVQDHKKRLYDALFATQPTEAAPEDTEDEDDAPPARTATKPPRTRR